MSFSVSLPVFSLTNAALLIRTSRLPPVIFAVSDAAAFSAWASVISAWNMCTFVMPSLARSLSVAALLRASPMTVLFG